MTQVNAEPTLRAKRPWADRKGQTKLRSPGRLTGADMRSRVGRAYKAAFISAVREFPGADAAKAAELARLRSIAALSQEAALIGNGSADSALKATAAADRCAKDLGTKP